MAIRARAHFDRRGDARSAHRVNNFVAVFNGREDGIPFPLDVRAIGVQMNLQPRVAEHLFAGGDVGAEADAHVYRHDA